MNTTRERIKEAALELFLERSYARTSIAAIETEAGLAPRAGGFYRHFDSKEALAVALAREDIVEQENELGFFDLLPLGDTKSELLLLARGYLSANKRQKKYYALIEELRRLPALAKFEADANIELFDWLCDWVATKKAGQGRLPEDLATFTLTVFGGLLLYTTKKLQGIELPQLSDEGMIEGWASHWASVLDAPAPVRKRSKISSAR
ncbi:MAG: hypothetical protein DHS20C05_02470 [Hyphococcus sp.]|nr:MAG: hypothetical protein DHS20C05_02470 [Marinicaulis sp.]